MQVCEPDFGINILGAYQYSDAHHVKVRHQPASHSDDDEPGGKRWGPGVRPGLGLCPRPAGQLLADAAARTAPSAFVKGQWPGSGCLPQRCAP
jgi:hypothetical protein